MSAASFALGVLLRARSGAAAFLPLRRDAAPETLVADTIQSGRFLAGRQFRLGRRGGPPSAAMRPFFRHTSHLLFFIESNSLR